MEEDTAATPDVPSPAAVDPAAARREARRRKILENSNNRLSKIVGREMETSSVPTAQPQPPDVAPAAEVIPDEFTSPPVKLPDIIYPDPEDERMVYDPLLGESEPPIDFSSLNGMMNGQNGDIFQLLNSLNRAQGGNGGAFGTTDGTTSAGAAQPEQYVRLRRTLRLRIHLVVAAVAIYLLFASGYERFIGGSVFLPLLAWELIELIMIGPSESSAVSPLLGMVLLLGGIPMRTSQILQKVLGTIQKVLRDVTFFVFFFVLTHLAWSMFGLGIELRYVLGYDQLEPPTITHSNLVGLAS
uniref:Putative calcium signal-modulating cyclophilin ligand n=1 Tax=Anopheles triannulatus TaxID=58253 RepID=A0A2M4AP59_9DIPT